MTLKEKIAEYLVQMDHTDDFIRGFGATLDELDDIGRLEAKAAATEILVIVKDHLCQ